MKSTEGNKIIAKLQKDLAKNGIKVDDLIKGLKEVREYALKEEDPTLTKVTRLVYEHLEANKTFNIPLPPEEAIEVEDGEEAELIVNEIKTDEDRIESLDYLLSLMLDRDNSSNKQDMFEYRDALKAY
ncbi:MAG: hypothetical protein J5I47_07875 [Vicingus serpentipes]|nr:hypothetical protein [Vicingus serpentipes]